MRSQATEGNGREEKNISHRVHGAHRVFGLKDKNHLSNSMGKNNSRWATLIYLQIYDKLLKKKNVGYPPGRDRTVKEQPMSLIKIEPALRDMIHGLGSNPETEAIKIFNMGLRELLRECDEEIMDLEIKYGTSYEEFLVSHKFLKKRRVHLSCIATKKQEDSRAYKPVAALF